MARDLRARRTGGQGGRAGHSRVRPRGGGSSNTGMIVAVVAGVAVVGAGLIYMMSGSTDTPATSSASSTRSTTQSAPVPTAQRLSSPTSVSPSSSAPVQATSSGGSPADRLKRKSAVRRIVYEIRRDLDLTKISESELRRRLQSEGREADVIEAALVARREQLRQEEEKKNMEDARKSGQSVYGSGFGSTK